MLEAPEGFDPFAPFKPREFSIGGPKTIRVTLFTDSHVIKGTVETRLRRLSDVLNQAEHDFIVLGDATMEELGANVRTVGLTPAIGRDFEHGVRAGAEKPAELSFYLRGRRT